MRICLYNLHLGGTGRADPLAEVLLAQHADVILLTQATDPDVLARLASRLHMQPVSDGPAAALTARHLTLLTTLHHAALRREPGDPDQDPGRSDQDPGWPGQDRGWPGLLELRIAARHAPAPELTLIVADADGAPHTLTWPARVLRPACPTVVAGTFQGPAAGCTADLVAAGYTDADTAPTFPTQHPTARPDRIFARGLTIRSARVETDRLATYASDHYPVTAELAPAP